MRLSIFFVHELFYLIVEGRNNIRGLVFKKKQSEIDTKKVTQNGHQIGIIKQMFVFYKFGILLNAQVFEVVHRAIVNV